MKKLEFKYYLTRGSNWDHWLGEEVNNPGDADIIVFTGGADVTPKLYGEERHHTTYCDFNRDMQESMIYNVYVNKKPMLGICRGSQFLTVMNGGKLIQNVTNHAIGRHHEITMYDGAKLQVTSTHHQMMYPFNLENDQYDLLGWAESLSDIYQHGSGEYNNIEKEPEIVYYPNTNCLAIQCHPEFHHFNEISKEYINNLILNKLFNE